MCYNIIIIFIINRIPDCYIYGGFSLCDRVLLIIYYNIYYFVYLLLRFVHTFSDEWSTQKKRKIQFSIKLELLIFENCVYLYRNVLYNTRMHMNV